MSSQPVFVTGTKSLDRELNRLGGPEIRKLLKKAAKDAGKIVKDKAVAEAPRETGALARSFSVRQWSRKHKAGTGKFRTATSKGGFTYKFEVKRIIAEDIGASIIIDPLKLRRHASKGKSSVKIKFRGRGKKKRAVLKDYYPAFVELGTRRQNGKAFLRNALWENSVRVNAYFVSNLRKLVFAARGKSA